jgi:hypothetical protein
MLILERDQLRFQYEKRRKSGLSLVIPKVQILSIDEYLLFGIERKGIAVRSENDRIDRFIVDDPRAVRKVLMEWMKN